MNLLDKLEERIAPRLMQFIRQAGEVASSRGQSLYLVGGGVRDLLLGRINIDLDLVAEGDAMDLATNLSQKLGARVTTYQQFGTAKIVWDNFTIDLVTARAEIYERPGALPTVRPGSLQEDLYRRDFTINAMALRLSPPQYGELVDLYGGREDLEKRLIRVLHNKSFIDDATRLFRALRYAHRLGFRVEKTTEELAHRDISYLQTISGDRLRHEIELIFNENEPEAILRKAEEWKILTQLCPDLKGNGWLTEKFKKARRVFAPKPPPISIYLSLLAWHLSPENNEQLIQRLNFPGKVARVMRDSLRVKEASAKLRDGLANSQVYELLNPYLPYAIQTNIVALEPSAATGYMQLYLDKLLPTKLELDGARLRSLGAPQGPALGRIMRTLLRAKLDGQISSKGEEEKLALELIAAQKQPDS
jgi:tRNA nucleotidyltransferase (CCA-adding enzyme)